MRDSSFHCVPFGMTVRNKEKGGWLCGAAAQPTSNIKEQAVIPNEVRNLAFRLYLIHPYSME